MITTKPIKLWVIVDQRSGRMVDRPYKFAHHACRRMLALGGERHAVGGWRGCYCVCSVTSVPVIEFSLNDDGTLLTEVTP